MIPPRRKNGGFSLREIVIAIALLGLFVTLMLPAIGRAREGMRRVNCANNLMQIGYALRLYTTESSDQKLPPVQIHVEFPSMSNPNYTGDLTEFQYRFRYDFAPSIGALYEEGAPLDPKVLICPSDFQNDLRTAQDFQCVMLNDSWDEGSRDFIKEGCANDLDDSYQYYGWVFDKGGDPVTHSASILEASWRNPFAKPRFDVDADPDFQVPVQMSATFAAMHRAAWGTTKADFFKTFTDETVNERTWAASDAEYDIGSKDFVEKDAWDPATFYGNGTTNTVHRLRGGVARFLVTDINSAEEARLTQSTIWVMHEKLALTPDGFFHPPGGSNVLYLDGHVEFVAFDERAPVKRSNAYFDRQFSNL
jgi:prepilin-type processing-associated H-X9-DG protein